MPGHLYYHQRIVEPILAEELLNARNSQLIDMSMLDDNEFNAFHYLLSKIHSRPFDGVAPTIIENRPDYLPRVPRDDDDEAG